MLFKTMSDSGPTDTKLASFSKEQCGCMCMRVHTHPHPQSCYKNSFRDNMGKRNTYRKVFQDFLEFFVTMPFSNVCWI